MALMADIGSKCTRRKQAYPKRKNVELENKMPEDNDLVPEAQENVDSADTRNCNNDKFKHSVNVSHDIQELELSANDKSLSVKANKKHSNNKTKKCLKQSDTDMICSPQQVSAKHVICNTINTNGYTKRNHINSNLNNINNTQQTNTNKSKDSDEVVINGHNEDDTDEQPNDCKQEDNTETKSEETSDKKEKTIETSSMQVLDKTEDIKIKEYLQRSDTAVIYAEPVDKVMTKNNSNMTCVLNEKVDQSVNNGIEEKDKTAHKVNVNRHLDDCSPNKNETTAPLNVLHARCPHCGRIFRGQRSTLSLEEHINSIHAVVVPSSKSNMASSPLASHSSDAIVSRTLTDKKYVCTQCKASFTQKDQLDKHELIHSSQGQRHMLSHDESQVLRKFKCPECFKAFKFKHHLKEHIRIHSGEKPFACPNCAKRFSHSGSYSSHMTSKKCLVVNLKVRKVDQIRGQRNRNNHHLNTNGNTGNKVNNLLANISDSQTNLKPLSTNYNKKVQQFDVSSNRNSSVLKSEANFQSICVPESTSLFSYIPNNYPPGLPNLHPMLFSTAAGLPPHYLSSALHNYPEVTTAILRSQMNKSNKELDLIRENYSINDKIDKNIIKNYDMEKIIQIVDPLTISKTGSESVNGSYGDTCSSNPSPLTFSMSSLPPPQITPLDSPDHLKKCNSLYWRCHYCNEYFDNKQELLQHESHVCKRRLLLNDMSSVDINSNNIQNIGNSSAAESDDESQRDSSLEEEVMTTDGKKVRVRSVLGEQTLRILRKQYEFNPRPKKHDILRLAQEVNYSPRVVQVWFQNMRARDRRLGKPIPSMTASNDMNSNNQRVIKSFSPPIHMTQHSATANSMMSISIPHYKPTSNLSENMSFPLYASDVNGLSPYGQRIHNNAVYYLSSPDLSITPSIKSNANKSFESCSDGSEEPLDLSIKSKSHNDDYNSNETEEKYNESEALNLSKKSSRSQTNDNSDNELSNVSLNLIQQQQRKEELEKSSIVRSMLLSKCQTQESDINIISDTATQSHHQIKDQLSPLDSNDTKDTDQQQLSSKRTHSDCEDIEPKSDCNNANDDKVSITRKNKQLTTTKSWKEKDDNNVITNDDQSPPPDPNLQTEGLGLFICDQCDKTFSKQSSLARHKYEHSGQRPHKCDVCSKAFKHKHHLTEHKRLHSGEKPFQCKKCLKRFSHSGSYSQHMNHRYSYCKPYRE
ncbi:zinc finger E-box-binding homeobox 1-like [Oppia nitens]|uniref:zinc finger E-box-binding homeobox 1-like n=1 Tax=Oppia nitens TaxID=1686743 RepID=UPI0023DA954E|nr:zinc finger E-box-binding homeobox 1-like [Oppia nitens]